MRLSFEIVIEADNTMNLSAGQVEKSGNITDGIVTNITSAGLHIVQYWEQSALPSIMSREYVIKRLH
jgi:hypothetical protein